MNMITTASDHAASDLEEVNERLTLNNGETWIRVWRQTIPTAPGVLQLVWVRETNNNAGQ